MFSNNVKLQCLHLHINNQQKSTQQSRLVAEHTPGSTPFSRDGDLKIPSYRQPSRSRKTGLLCSKARKKLLVPQRSYLQCFSCFHKKESESYPVKYCNRTLPPIWPRRHRHK